MNKLTALFFVLLVSYNMIYSFDLRRFKTSTIRGKLTQILVEVQTTEDVKSIRQFLDVIHKMLTQLIEDQKQHEETSKKMMAQCEEEDKFREREVADANDALSRGTAARGKCQDALNEDNKNLPQLEDALDKYQKELKRATEQREEEHKRYVEISTNYKEAIDFLRGFIEYVQDKFKGKLAAFSFAQLSEKIMTHSIKLNAIEKAVPVLIAMAQTNMPEHNQYTYTAPEAAGNELKDALSKLLADLVADLQGVEDREKAAQEAFERYSASLKAMIETLTKNIQVTNEHITAMKKCVDEEKAIINTASAKLQRNDQLRESARNMCDCFAKEFTEATRNRLEEIKTIREICGIITKRFGELPKDLVAYLEETENGWKAYVNSTEFQKFEEYQQHHTENNAHGDHLVNNEHINEVEHHEVQIQAVGY